MRLFRHIEIDPRPAAEYPFTFEGNGRQYEMKILNQKNISENQWTIHEWALLALAFTLIGLLNFCIAMIGVMAGQGYLPWNHWLVLELLDSYAVFALLPVVLWFMARYPMDLKTWKRRLAPHILFSFLFGAAHASILCGSGKAFHILLNWDQYNYSFISYRFLMSGIKQIFTYWLIYFIFTTIRYAQKSRESEIAASKLEQELVQARLTALKMQLNPHFLFNTLNMISSDIEHKPHRADATLHHLSDFLRITLRNAPTQEVSLAKEIELLEPYLEIMRARFEDRLIIEVAVPEETHDMLVPHLILQPLIENSITQCMADVSRQGYIRIASVMKDHRLCLIIEDNGPGLPAAKDGLPTRGIGLSNTTERLRHLYQEAQRLEIFNRPEGGLRLTIEIPARPAGSGRAS
jgi:two-component system, LytTR family, sensor kinase